MTQKSDKRVLEILREVKALAQEYHSLTGRPLGITGEVAEYEAARLLKLTLSPVRQSGYATASNVTRSRLSFGADMTGLVSIVR